MNWTDKPMQRLKSHRQRKDHMLSRLQQHWNDSGRAERITVPTVKVLTAWHVDEHGCRARTVGNEN